MIARSVAQRMLRSASTITKVPSRHLTTQTLRQMKRILPLQLRRQIGPSLCTSQRSRHASTESSAPSPQNTPAGDAAVEEITELYATAYDEFEIATESTEANATYAEEDRKAARDELENVLAAYKRIGDGDAATAEEVRRRVGQRIRELEQGVKAMEERAMEHD